MTTPQGTVELTEIVFPAEANHYGTLFGGNALQLMAKAAFLAARGAAARDVVMAGVTDVRFWPPCPWAMCSRCAPGSAAWAAARSPCA